MDPIEVILRLESRDEEAQIPLRLLEGRTLGEDRGIEQPPQLVRMTSSIGIDTLDDMRIDIIESHNQIGELRKTTGAQPHQSNHGYNKKGDILELEGSKKENSSTLLIVEIEHLKQRMDNMHKGTTPLVPAIL